MKTLSQNDFVKSITEQSCSKFDYVIERLNYIVKLGYFNQIDFKMYDLCQNPNIWKSEDFVNFYDCMEEVMDWHFCKVNNL